MVMESPAGRIEECRKLIHELESYFEKLAEMEEGSPGGFPVPRFSAR